MSDRGIIMTTITEQQCLEFSDGYHPPRLADYADQDEFLEDASAFWAAFTAAMRASGVNDASLLLAGCLPDDWEIAEIERTNARTAATREENA